MKSQQNANPVSPLVIVLVILGLFLFYVLWIPPEERQALLYGNETIESQVQIQNQTINQSHNVSVGGNVLLDVSPGYIGKPSGQRLGYHQIGYVMLSYPLEKESIKEYSNVLLKANILNSDSKIITFYNLDLENTKEVILKLYVSEKEGNPDLVIYLNGKEYQVIHPEVGDKVELDISRDELKENNEIKIVCVFKGLLPWETQYYKFEKIELERKYYEKYKEKDIREFTVTKYEASPGNRLRLIFNVSESDTKGKLTIKINGVPVFVEKPEVGNYLAETSVNSVNLVEGTNIASFEVEKGGKYVLNNVVIEVYEELGSVPQSKFTFDKTMEGNITVEFLVSDILEPGTIYFTFLGKKYVTYEYKNVKLGWNRFQIDPSILLDMGNTLEIKSINGRFIIDEVRLVVE